MTSENGSIYVKVGVCGSSSVNNAKDWDDSFHLAIRHIYVYYSENILNSIQVAYSDSSTSTVLSPMHGSALTNDFFEEICISPDDLIVSVSGFYSTESVGYNSINQLLKSLKFETASGKTYGPYGDKSQNASDRTNSMPYGTKSKSFCFKTTSGVRGFHGSTNGSSLCSIGIYVQPQSSPVS